MIRSLGLLAILFTGCGSNGINFEIQQAAGDRGFEAGTKRAIQLIVYGGGDRFTTSHYQGPVDVLVTSLPEGITIEPPEAIIEMKRVNSYDRHRSTTEVMMTVDSTVPPGQYEIKAKATTRKNTSAECTFLFNVIAPKTNTLKK